MLADGLLEFVGNGFESGLNFFAGLDFISLIWFVITALLAGATVFYQVYSWLECRHARSDREND